MKKKLKDELDNRNTIQEYICPSCNRRYSAFDAMQLVSMEDEYFHWEGRNGELVTESDKLATEEVGDGDDNSRRWISSSSSSSSVMEVEIVLAVGAFTYAWRCCSREDEDLSS